MRVLFLSQWFPPEPAQVPLEIAESLAGLGHEVDVVTGFPNYPAGRLYPGYAVRPFQRETVHGLAVLRVPLYPEHSRSAAGRAANYLSFAASAAVLPRLLLPRPDVIHVYGTPYTAGLAGRALAAAWRVPFVFNVQDLWPEGLRASGMVSPTVMGLVEPLVRYVYRHAAAIVPLSQGYAERIVAAGAPAAKVHVLSNWVDTELHRPAPRDDAFRKELGLHGKLVLLCAGSMGPPQALGSVLDAAAKLGDAPIAFVFIGDGIEKAALEARARDLGLGNVKFLPRVPEREIARFYGLADALLVHLRSDPAMDVTIPHRVLTYLALGKPIVGAVRGDAARVIEDAGAGLVCAPQDPDALAATARKLAALPAEARAAMGARGRQAAETLYARPMLAKKLGGLLEAVAREAGAA